MLRSSVARLSASCASCPKSSASRSVRRSTAAPSSASCFWDSSSAAKEAFSCLASASRCSEICARFAATAASWAARRSASAARFRCAARLSLLDVSLKALELLLYGATRSRGGRERALEFCFALLEVLRRRNRVCCAVLLGALECHSRVAQLPFERLTRRRSLRHGLLERCPGVRRFQRSLFLRCLERGRRGTQLPCQRITLIGELRDVRSDYRVVRGTAFRIGGALRGMPRLGLLDVSLKALELLFRCGTRTAAAASAPSNSALRSSRCCAAAAASATRCSSARSSAAAASLSCRSKARARRRSLRHRLLELIVEGMPLGCRGG